MSLFLSGLKFIFIDLIGDFLYWPIWWYTSGLKTRIVAAGEQIKLTWRALGLGLWLKSMFKPMYADKSFTGRAISLVMRIIILVWKLLWMLLWTLIVILVLLLWIIAPLAVIYMLYRQFKLLNY